MIWNDRLREWLGSSHDHVAALLTTNRESELLEGADKVRTFSATRDGSVASSSGAIGGLRFKA